MATILHSQTSKYIFINLLNDDRINVNNGDAQAMYNLNNQLTGRYNDFFFTSLVCQINVDEVRGKRERAT